MKFFAGVFLLCCYALIAVQAKEHRVLFVLDGAAGMNDSWSDKVTKYQTAARFIADVIDSVYHTNDQVEFGLRVYGHQYAAAAAKCNDTRTEVNFTKDNYAQMALRLQDIKAKGTGSSFIALRAALKNDLLDTQNYFYTIVLIRGAGSDCADDVCAAVDEVNAKSFLYRIFVADVAKFTATPCADKSFVMSNDAEVTTAVDHIKKQYPRYRRPALPQATKAKPKPEAPVVQSKPKVIIEDTVKKPITAPVVEVPINVKKGSKLIAEDPDKKSYVNMLNLMHVKHIKIYKVDKGVEQETHDIFPIGVNTMQIDVEPGEYRMIYTTGYTDGAVSTFPVKAGQTVEVYFR